jgi:hypothetical protein
MSLLPVSEWQGDVHSSGFRLKRSAVQSVVMLADQLKNIGNVKSCRNWLKKVKYNRYFKNVGFRNCTQSSLQNKTVAKRRFKYFYTY